MRKLRLCGCVLFMIRGVGKDCKGRGAVGLKSSEKDMASGKRRRNMEIIDMGFYFSEYNLK